MNCPYANWSIAEFCVCSMDCVCACILVQVTDRNNVHFRPDVFVEKTSLKFVSGFLESLIRRRALYMYMYVHVLIRSLIEACTSGPSYRTTRKLMTCCVWLVHSQTNDRRSRNNVLTGATLFWVHRISLLYLHVVGPFRIQKHQWSYHIPSFLR